MHVEISITGARADENRVVLDGHDITAAVMAEGLSVDLRDISQPLVSLVIRPDQLSLDLADALLQTQHYPTSTTSDPQEQR